MRVLHFSLDQTDRLLDLLVEAVARELERPAQPAPHPEPRNAEALTGSTLPSLTGPRT